MAETDPFARGAAAGAPRPLGQREPVAGGRDLWLPGVGVRLGATRWHGTAPTVVLLHGLASQRRFWDLVVPGLAGASVLALDQRGHGDSDRPEHGPYDVGQCADDVAVSLDAAGIAAAVLVGHSWGASVAAEFGARFPERTLAVVAVDGPLRRPVPPGPRRAALRERLYPPRLAMTPEALQARLLDRLGSAVAVAALLPSFVVHPDGLARARLDFDLHLQVLDGMLDHDPVAALLAVRAPTWVVACDGADRAARARDEPSGPSMAAAREAALSELVDASSRAGSTLRVMRWMGAEHDVPLQWPALVSGLVQTAASDAARSGA